MNEAWNVINPFSACSCIVIFTMENIYWYTFSSKLLFFYCFKRMKFYLILLIRMISYDMFKTTKRLQYEYLIKICSFITKPIQKLLEFSSSLWQIFQNFSSKIFQTSYLQWTVCVKIIYLNNNQQNLKHYTTLTTSFSKPSTTILLFFRPAMPLIPPSGKTNTSSGCHAGCANSFKFRLLSLKSLNENSPRFFVFPWRANTLN